MAKGSLINKQNRLDRLLGLLRQDDAWTMQLLSERLQVSQRTLLRDINELKDQGCPIQTERGRGGGVALDHRWGVDKLRLSDEEVVNLLVSLAITESLQSPILTTHVTSIRQKITHGFPDQQRKLINQLRSRILVGGAASADIVATYTPPKNKVTDVVNRSFFHLKVIDFYYTSGSGEQTQRSMEPQFLFFNWPIWYVLGWDYLRDAPRVFRLDRIRSVKKNQQSFKLRKRADVLQGLEQYFGSL